MILALQRLRGNHQQKETNMKTRWTIMEVHKIYNNNSNNNNNKHNKVYMLVNYKKKG